jgi:hypothetical protein
MERRDAAAVPARASARAVPVVLISPRDRDAEEQSDAPPAVPQADAGLLVRHHLARRRDAVDRERRPDNRTDVAEGRVVRPDEPVERMDAARPELVQRETLIPANWVRRPALGLNWVRGLLASAAEDPTGSALDEVNLLRESGAGAGEQDVPARPAKMSKPRAA